ncbi:MAG: aminodeoxychorismate synthase component I [Clostridiales bacterium]|nr:aminodeoxychorismate synthase component I [Clostridiales bacterium]
MKDVLMYRADAEELFRQLRDLPGALFLDSSMRDARLGKYSMILFDPFAELVAFENKIRFRRYISATSVNNVAGANSKYPFERSEFSVDARPLDVIGEMMEYFRISKRVADEDSGTTGARKEDASSILPCENGCAAGYLSYDLGFTIEHIGERARRDIDVPTVILRLYDLSVVMDHADQTAYICAAETIRGVERKDLVQQIARVREKIDAACEEKIDGRSGFRCEVPKSNFSREEYCEMIRKAREYIQNGDIFQVNLSQRFSGRFSGDPYVAYRELRRICPAPFSAYMSHGSLQILSSSPERFFESDGRMIRTRPIKGTRRRGETAEEDRFLLRELSESEKDRAELIMIVDLLRNDLGRICRVGSIEVEKLCEWEAYENVFHQVSTVRGELTPGAGAAEILRAVFPGGSITGAPKIRAMEIIDLLEPCKRGIYTGSIGYFGFDGRADMNIAIRTLVCFKDQFYYQVGGGIVWDSVPDDEYMETLYKGRSIREMLELFRDE